MSMLPPIIAWKSSRPVVNCTSSKVHAFLREGAAVHAGPDLPSTGERVQVAELHLLARLARSPARPLIESAAARPSLEAISSGSCAFSLMIRLCGVFLHHEVADVRPQFTETRVPRAAIRGAGTANGTSTISRMRVGRAVITTMRFDR
jgi:hypothetical protein